MNWKASQNTVSGRNELRPDPEGIKAEVFQVSVKPINKVKNREGKES